MSKKIKVPVSETEAQEDNVTLPARAIAFVDEFCKQVYYHSEAAHKAAYHGYVAGFIDSEEERKHTDKEEYAKGLLEWIRDQDYVLSDYRAGKWYQFPFRETSHYYTTTELLKEYDKHLQK
jgi:hypothetical protein